MQKSLDRKLAAIHDDPQGCPDFILADAKDADMAFGIGAPGLSPERHDTELKYKTLGEYRDQIRAVIRQGIVDIVLMSASTSEQLTLREGLFDNSHVTPAIRANDATDVHAFRGSRIPQAPAHPFRTASIDHAQCGHLDCAPEERPRGANLGLYSVTFNNDLQLDLHTLEQYNAFRAEAERKGFRHFLEVFNPNVPGAVSDEQLPYFINDVIARTLAGVASAGRPVFLKIPYNGPHAMQELVAYDPHLIVGVLGGSAGTTLDAFTLLFEAKKYGARAALFGRKINQAENQLAFIEFLRHIADGVIEPIEAVRAYHAVLEKLGQKPHRSLEDDLTLQTNVMSYGGSSTFTSLPPARKSGESSEAATSPATTAGADDESPDFSSMSSEERLAYHRQRLGRLLGP
ncbi:hypothetical protein [Maioricimonas sp. JC845]|uniref:hypothetical protein n=1 Tax=Maioricimonas sp. JC845 TaxID=3232138 RepID=UPI00345992C2